MIRKFQNFLSISPFLCFVVSLITFIPLRNLVVAQKAYFFDLKANEISYEEQCLILTIQGLVNAHYGDLPSIFLKYKICILSCTVKKKNNNNKQFILKRFF